MNPKGKVEGKREKEKAPSRCPFTFILPGLPNREVGSFNMGGFENFNQTGKGD